MHDLSDLLVLPPYCAMISDIPATERGAGGVPGDNKCVAGQQSRTAACQQSRTAARQQSRTAARQHRRGRRHLATAAQYVYKLILVMGGVKTCTLTRGPSRIVSCPRIITHHSSSYLDII